MILNLFLNHTHYDMFGQVIPAIIWKFKDYIENEKLR
jgi:hypothetical protein